jgi:hypothetical protein
MATTPESRGLASIESALRHLGVQDHGLLVDLIKHAIERPLSEAGVKLAALTQPTATLVDWTAADRAHALWRIIIDGVHDPDVAPTAHSRTRRVLQAAFRLCDDDIREPWGSSLSDVQHTFMQACQPRESYGLAFKWPESES